jgi:lactoylglutathione lyase
MARLGIQSINDRLNILDPWGNRVEIVPYDDCQFTKTPQVLTGMGVDAIEKSASAIEELRKKGMAAQT